jgi:uncharacterized phage protein gp47/JayE
MARYENETKDAILQRMLDATSSDIDKRQGSVTYDMLSPAALELAQAFIELDNVLNFGFADTTYGQYLYRRASEIGLTRKPSVKAIGKVTFIGTDGTVIPIGTKVSTDETKPKYFLTTIEGTIGATVSGEIKVDAVAEVAGADGNVAANKITLVASDLSGVTSVNNGLAFDGGTNTETDTSLLDRYFERVQKPSTSGNANHYVQWAKDVAGVGDAKVYPLWNGNGTVKVVIIDEQKTAPPAAIVTDVTNYIADRRPVGASVTVEGATEVLIDVSADITLEPGYTMTDAQAEIESALTTYLAGLAFNDPTVRYTQIGNIIIDAKSVLDYASLTVNAGTTNITIADGSVAVKGTVSLV